MNWKEIETSMKEMLEKVVKETKRPLNLKYETWMGRAVDPKEGEEPEPDIWSIEVTGVRYVDDHIVKVSLDTKVKRESKFTKEDITELISAYDGIIREKLKEGNAGDATMFMREDMKFTSSKGTSIPISVIVGVTSNQIVK